MANRKISTLFLLLGLITSSMAETISTMTLTLAQTLKTAEENNPEIRAAIKRWDATKAKSNAKKHGVTFGEALTTFADPLALTYRDEEHSLDEERFLTVGRSKRQRLLVVAHRESEQGHMRIISARLATAKEIRDHEEK